VLASLIACLGIERKETTAHTVEEQNRRGKQKGCAAAAEEERGQRRTDAMALQLGEETWRTSPGASAAARERVEAVGARAAALVRASADEAVESVPSGVLARRPFPVRTEVEDSQQEADERACLVSGAAARMGWRLGPASGAGQKQRKQGFAV
jgi:hypothetical protein